SAAWRTAQVVSSNRQRAGEPAGMPFHCLQATTHAPQPMQRAASKAYPRRSSREGATVAAQPAPVGAAASAVAAPAPAGTPASAAGAPPTTRPTPAGAAAGAPAAPAAASAAARSAPTPPPFPSTLMRTSVCLAL